MTRFTATLLTFAVLAPVSIASADPYRNVTSGMLLGIYAHANGHGLKVTSTIPGYSAQDRLFPGDVLLQTTMDGYTVYKLRSLREMEHAKMAIGPNREAAIEFYRPGHGLMYGWVEFTPLYGPAAAATATNARSGQKQYQAQFKLESEKPGARQMFSRGQNKTGAPPTINNPSRTLPPAPQKSNGSIRDARSLFGR